jgi:hypothetical protein
MQFAGIGSSRFAGHALDVCGAAAVAVARCPPAARLLCSYVKTAVIANLQNWGTEDRVMARPRLLRPCVWR